ncbi:MAG: tetratricopeptide repeat protein [Proteobacteria bacterium]|nr:tetratricopeptide repeat protein [Pseudomonadota bacterium]
MAKKEKIRKKRKEEKTKGRTAWWHYLVPLCLLVVVGFGVYANSLNGDFIWDDKELIVKNHYIKNLDTLSVVLTKDFFYRSQEQGKVGYYRPLITLSYMLDYRLWKLNPFGYHLTNLIFHILNCLLVCLTGYFLSGSLLIAFLSSLLFAIHPIHTESVSWISGRTDVIASFFFFSSLLLYLHWVKVERWWYYACSLILFAFALLSKEMVMTLPLLLVLHDYYFVAGKEIAKMWGRVKYWTGYLLLIVIYFIIRFAVFQIGTGNPYVEGLNRLNVVLTFGKGFLYYLWKLILPFNLNAYVMLDLGSFTQTGVWAGIMLIAGLVLMGLRSQDVRISFGIGFFLISLLPLTNLIPISAPMDFEFPLAERFLYIPSFGFCLVLGVLIAKGVILDRWKVGGMVFLLICFYSFNTFDRNKDWRDEALFYLRTLTASPQSSVVHNNLGNILLDKGLFDEAEARFRQAVKLKPTYGAAYNNLGNVYFRRGIYEQAIEFYKKALGFDPNYPEIYNNLGNIYENVGNHNQAIYTYREALRIRPQFAEAHNNLGITYYHLKMYDEAIQEYEEAIRLGLDSVEVRNNLGNVYNDQGMPEKAIREYTRAITFDPRNHIPYLNLAVVYALKYKDREKAIYNLKMAESLNAPRPQIEMVEKMISG